MPKRSSTSDEMGSEDIYVMLTQGKPQTTDEEVKTTTTGKRLFGKIRRPDRGKNNLDSLTVFRSYAYQFC